MDSNNYAQQIPYGTQPTPKKKGKTVALVSMICAGIGLLWTLLPFMSRGFVVAVWLVWLFVIAALVLAIIAACKRNYKGALIGFALTILTVIVYGSNSDNYASMIWDIAVEVAEELPDNVQADFSSDR